MAEATQALPEAIWGAERLEGLPEGSVIYVCEYLGTAEMLWAEGAPAVSLPRGPGHGNWRPQLARVLAGHHAVIPTDSDSERGLLMQIAQMLQNKCLSVKLCPPCPELPSDMTDGEQVSDLQLFIEQRGAGEVIKWALEVPGVEMPHRNGKAPAKTLRGVTVELTLASEIEPQAVDWLWQYRVPVGCLTLVVGHGGVGKGFLTMAVTAAVTRGIPLPGDDRPRRAGSVVWVEFEDDPHTTLRPRADLCGVDLGKLYVLTGAKDEGGEPAVPGPAALADLERKIVAIGDVKLVVFSPLLSWLGGAFDQHRDNEVRAALQPVADFAARTGIAVLGIGHPRKAEVEEPLHMILGSVAFGAAVRAALVVAIDPQSRRRGVAQLKANLGPEAPTIEYDLRWPDGIRWIGEAPDLSLENFLAPRKRSGVGAAQAAEVWLLEMLQAGPQWVRDVEDAAEAAGFSQATARRARQKVAVAGHWAVPGGKSGEGAWYLRLVDAPDAPPNTSPPPPRPRTPKRPATPRDQGAQPPGEADQGAPPLEGPQSADLRSNPDLFAPPADQGAQTSTHERLEPLIVQKSAHPPFSAVCPQCDALWQGWSDHCGECGYKGHEVTVPGKVTIEYCPECGAIWPGRLAMVCGECGAVARPIAMPLEDVAP